MRRAFILTLPAVLALVVGCSMSDPAAPAKADPAAASPRAVKAAPANGGLTLGEPITAKPVALADIAKDPKPYQDKVIATSGIVTAVCQSMGCWMELKDDSGEAHVKLAGHTFFVPKDASGRHARVQARVLKTNPDDECAQEAAEQTGKPVAKLELEATGVELD